jgi:methionyl-tRNA formyltransferase
MTVTSEIRVVYAANRAIGVRALGLLHSAGIAPIAYLLPDGSDASHTADIKAAAAAGVPVIEGKAFREPRAIDRLAALAPDYILSVHFPYLFTRELLAVPRVGTLNLHPAMLPFNRGWHTPSWAIIDGTPIGATLHWVDEGVDSGDIALQRAVPVRPQDTANVLYQRLLATELDLLKQAIPLLAAKRLPRTPQQAGGSSHRKNDLAAVQALEPNRTVRISELINLLRGLTTNNIDEAAFFVEGDRRYRLRLEIIEQPLLKDVTG